MGVFARIMIGLVAEEANHNTIIIDATYLKENRTASSLRLKKGRQTDLLPSRRCRREGANQGWDGYEAACRYGQPRALLHIRWAD